MNTPRRENARYFRDRLLGGLDALHATYVRHRFAPHLHEAYAIGVIEHGTEVFACGRETFAAPAGRVVVVNPYEVHTGHAGDATGWTYRMLYPSIPLMRGALESALERPVHGFPVFPTAVIDDPELAARLAALHRAMQHGAPPLARQSLLAEALTLMCSRHAAPMPGLPPTPPAHAAVRRAREHLDAHPERAVSLDDLATTSGLSPYHLLRVFREQVGLTPHAYHLQRRLEHARRLLARGTPPAEAALASGFSDQSHLARRFKEVYGLPPGQYRDGAARS